MKCVLCGTTGCDGATDQNGEFVCQDCWAAGEATGRTASRFVPAGLEYPFPFPRPRNCGGLRVSTGKK